MKTDWAAQFYDGETPERHDTTVRIGSAGVEFDLLGQRIFWPFTEIRQSQGAFPGEVVRLDRGPAMLVIPDRRFLIDVHPYAPHLKQEVADRDSSTLLVLLAGSAATVLVLVLLILFGGPILVSAAADLIPRSWEESLGRAAITGIAPPSQRCETPELKAALDTITSRLGRETRGYTFRVVVVDSPVVNAVAAPGGHIAIYRGLLDATDTPEQLAGVLAHEMQHVTQRHSTRGLIRAIGIAGLAGMIFGDASTIGGLAGQLGQLSFQRGDEERADLQGMRALRDAGIDPRAMIDAYRKLEQASPDAPEALSYLSTHPQMAGRIEQLERLASERGGPLPRPLGIANWDAIKSACAATGP